MTMSLGPRRLSVCMLTLFITACELPLRAWAGEWPQILGPNRNGIAAADEKLADRWPEGGPKLIWRRDEIGSGFGGVAVAGGKVGLFHPLEGAQGAEGLQAAPGQPPGKASVPPGH